MGTFLVRSGVLSSVHAFAVDPSRGVFVLGIMTLFTGGGLALFAYRARDMTQGGVFSPISREGALVLNNILLTTACATVLVGTLYPLALEAVNGDKISVGAPYFNMTFVPLMIPLLIAVPFGPFLAWKRADAVAAAERLAVAGVLAVLAIAVAMAMTERGPWLAPLGFAVGVWVMAGALSEVAFRTKVGQVPVAETWRRLLSLPRASIGTLLAHFGVGLMVLGIVGTTAYRSEQILVMKPGDRTEIAGYELTFRGATPAKGPNYSELVGVFDVSRGGETFLRLEPSKRLYDAPPQPTTEAGIHASWRGDLYAVLGDQQASGGFAVRLYFHPLVRCIWIGALIMFMGGAVSLSDRRLRIGAPRRASRAAVGVPAE
jgi:cytochrome c-type biogenesis protein CcmF